MNDRRGEGLLLALVEVAGRVLVVSRRRSVGWLVIGHYVVDEEGEVNAIRNEGGGSDAGSCA